MSDDAAHGKEILMPLCYQLSLGYRWGVGAIEGGRGTRRVHVRTSEYGSYVNPTGSPRDRARESRS